MTRQIFLNQALGRRQFKEVFGTLLLSNFLSKGEIWLVSPWITDFELLDNTANQWNSLAPNFEARYIRLSEVVITLVRAGVPIYIVTRQDSINDAFLSNLRYQLTEQDPFQICFRQELHTKGMLCKEGFIEGSLNLTYSGVESNDETVVFSTNPQHISNAFLEFKKQYKFCEAN